MNIQLGDDILDSRDIIKRIDELESEAADLAEELEDLTNLVSTLDNIQDDIACTQDELGDLKDELTMWRLFEDAGAPDWLHGEQFINDTYFAEYAEQLADDLGLINSDAGWPNQHINWDAAAQDLQQDYMAVEVDTYTYWVRA